MTKEKCRGRLIYHLTDRGIASEINLMVLAVLYSMQFGTMFHLHSRFWNLAYRSGWTDYFYPFCPELSSFFYYRRNVRGLPSSLWLQPPFRFLNWLQETVFPNDRYPRDIWAEMRSDGFVGRHFVFPEHHIDGDIFESMSILMRHIYRLNEKTEREVRTRIADAISSEHDVSVHIRRGDKVSTREAEPIPVNQYLRKIQDLHVDVSKVFLATDDYLIVEEFRELAPSAWCIDSLCVKSQNGHCQRVFNKSSKAVKKQNAIDFFADVRMLSSAKWFIGTYSSNIGMLVAMLREGIGCCGLDGDWDIRYSWGMAQERRRAFRKGAAL